VDDSHDKYGIFLVYHESQNVPPNTHESLPGLQNSDTFSVPKEVCFVVDRSVPTRICWKIAVQGMRRAMKNLSMTASVMVKTQTRHIPHGSIDGKIYILTAVLQDVMFSSWVSSHWCFQGTGIV